MVLETDALVVVQSLASLHQSNSPLRLIAEDNKEILRCFESSLVYHIRRFAYTVTYKIDLPIR